jgi:signal transduction histidine kinase
VRVLFISPGDGEFAPWNGQDGREVEVIRERSLQRAEPTLAATDGNGVDAVVLDPEAARDMADLRARLERSEARFRDVIEHNADAIMVVDPEGVVRFANGVAAELFGRPRDELEGSPFGHPMTVGKSTELDLVRRGGDPAVVELRVVESEWEGRPARIVSLRDITERKRAEEDARGLIRARAARAAAELSARRFRFLAESTALLSSSLEYERTLSALARLCVAEIADWVLIYMRDDEGTVRRLEVAHRDADKRDLVRRLKAMPIEAEGNHPVLEVLETGRPVLVRSVGREGLARISRDDRHLAVMRELGVTSFMLVPLIARGRSLGAIGLVCADPDRHFDDPDLALAETLASRAALAVDNARLYREAHAATQAKSDLLAVISHDLRTPLNSIIGYAELLIMGVPEPLHEGSRERVERIRAGARHLLQLIDQLLTLSRLDAGREEAHLEDMDGAELVREVGVVVEPLAQERELEFRIDLPEEPIPMRSDPGKLRQVLVNLSANAVKFTDSGHVRIEARPPEDGRVIFRVEDTGRGIPAEHLGNIFEPFWQVDPARRAVDGGTGLGLSVVRRLVELLGGDIQVESEVGRGTAFTVTLPAGEA